MENSSTVLVIDDNPVTGKMLERILHTYGYQILQAESGSEGRILAQAHSPDLILLDIMMPDESGFDTCGALKLDPKTAGIPVIFVSAVHEVEQKVKGLTLGAVDYITKPFNRDELLARANLHIGLKQTYSAQPGDQGLTVGRLKDCQQATPIKPRAFPGRRPDTGGLMNRRSFVSGADTKTFLSSFPKQLFLNPGEHHASNEKVTIRTILGSCVAACLWDEPNKVIGMNHFLLADKHGADNKPFTQTEAGKYGVYAMELLINAMIKLGARRENLRAKVFGGSSILNPERADSFIAVGEANSRFVLEFLRTDGIRLVNSDLGGTSGRVIYFCSEDFSVYVRKVGKAGQDKIILEEKNLWSKSIKREEKPAGEPEIWL